MNRRTFLNHAVLALAASTLPTTAALAEWEPEVVFDRNLSEEELWALPVGSKVIGCRLEITKPVPTGIDYLNCYIVTLPGFVGEYMIQADGDDPRMRDFKRRFGRVVQVIGCHFDPCGMVSYVMRFT